MEALIERINFEVISEGEQIFVSRIKRKDKAGLPLSKGEKQFINDMISRSKR